MKNDEIIQLYNQTKSTYKTAEILGIDKNYVYRFLKSINYKLDGTTGPRQENKISINEEYFSKIDTSEKAYWLGFIAADGCIRKQKSGSYMLTFYLSEKDAQQIIEFKQAINSNHNISIRNKEKNKVVGLTIVRKKLTDDLMSLGIVPNKTSTPFYIPEQFTSDWLRGLFDGDGSFWVRNRKNQINLKKQIAFSFSCSTIEQVNQIKDIFIQNNIFGGTIYKATENGYHFTFEGNKKIAKIATLIYGNNSMPRMERKYNIVKHLLDDKVF